MKQFITMQMNMDMMCGMCGMCVMCGMYLRGKIEC